MKSVNFFIILLVVILIFVAAALFVLQYFIKVPTDWPYIFYLTNLGPAPQKVKVLVNGYQYKVYSLPPGLKGQVTIGSNLENPKTGKAFARDEVVNVAFFFDKTPDVKYSSRNVKQAPTFSGTKCPGEGCPKETEAAPRAAAPVYGEITMNKQGYYTIFF